MNETEKNLIEAFQNYNPRIIEDVFRIYYDPITGEATSTSIELKDEPHIIVDKETLQNFRAGQQKIENGKIVDKIFDYKHTYPFAKDNSGIIKSVKDRSMFIVDDTYTGETDSWKFKL